MIHQEWCYSSDCLGPELAFNLLWNIVLLTENNSGLPVYMCASNFVSTLMDDKMAKYIPRGFSKLPALWTKLLTLLNLLSLRYDVTVLINYIASCWYTAPDNTVWVWATSVTNLLCSFTHPWKVVDAIIHRRHVQVVTFTAYALYMHNYRRL